MRNHTSKNIILEGVRRDENRGVPFFTTTLHFKMAHN